MTLSQLKKFKSILILGYGIEGKSAEKFFRAKLSHIKIAIADQNDGPDYLKKQFEYDMVIKSPGIPKKLLKVPYTTPTNIFFANTRYPVIGITGSKGKSTTTTLISNILKAAKKPAVLVGNIGKPMLDELLTETRKKRIYVCELSSYQLDDITSSPHIAVITNLFPDHMDYHGGISKYYKAKQNIVKFSTAKDFLVYFSKNKKLQSFASGTKAKAIAFDSETPITLSKTKFIGTHNLHNMAAATAVAKILKISEKDIRDGILNTKPLAHRLEYIGTYKDISFFDDAISTTPESTILALKAIPNVSTLMLGGKNRGYHFASLAKEIKKRKISNLVFFPESGKLIEQELKKINFRAKHILHANNMKDAVAFAYRHTPKAKICLLSTASPSYSLWKNFEEKGDEFQRWVKNFGTNMKQ